MEKLKFVEGREILEISETFLNLAVKGNWPPSCPRHPSALKYLFHFPWEENSSENSKGSHSHYFSLQKDSSLSHSKMLVKSCWNCKESLWVQFPQVFPFLLKLCNAIWRREENSEKIPENSNSPNAHKNSVENYVVFVIRMLIFVVEDLPYNQKKLAGMNLLKIIFDLFGDILQAVKKKNFFFKLKFFFFPTKKKKDSQQFTESFVDPRQPNRQLFHEFSRHPKIPRNFPQRSVSGQSPRKFHRNFSPQTRPHLFHRFFTRRCKFPGIFQSFY